MLVCQKTEGLNSDLNLTIIFLKTSSLDEQLLRTEVFKSLPGLTATSKSIVLF